MVSYPVRTSSRLVLIPAALAVLVAGTGALSAPGAGGVTAQIRLGKEHAKVKLATGVLTWRQTIKVHDSKGWHAVRTVLLRVHPAAGGPRIDAGSPGSIVGLPRTPVKAQADVTGALAGINADFFSWDVDTARPHGALIINGNVVKTPPDPTWNANFYVRADGTAAIGPLPYTGTLTRKPRTKGDPVKTHSIRSLNTIIDAEAGHITLVTHGLATVPISKKCTVALGTTVSGHKSIVSISRGHAILHRPDRSHWDLVACGGKGARWLNRNVQAGDRVNTPITFTNGAPIAAVSGARVLRLNGQTFHDVGGIALGPGPNPETFACASKSGTSVLFGVLDGRSTVSYGVTYSQLNQYMKALNCWSGLVFDGGGSSTMVARLPGAKQTTVLNVPSDGRQREIADGLYVYGS